MHARTRGFTVYELLITLMLVALLAGIAVPSFSTLIARSRQRAELNALFHAVHVARKESIMRHQVVSICPSIDGTRCNPGPEWSFGWIMFNNRDRDEPPRIDAGEPLLQVHKVRDSVRITANRRGFTLRATEKRATNGTLVVCDSASRVAPEALVISYTGRPRMARETTGGDRYECAD